MDFSAVKPSVNRELMYNIRDNMLVFNGNIWMAVVFGCVMFGVTFCWKFLDNLVLICFWPQNLAHLVTNSL